MEHRLKVQLRMATALKQKKRLARSRAHWRRWLARAAAPVAAGGCIMRRWLPCRFVWLAPLAALPETPMQLCFMSNELTTSWNQIAERQTQTDYIRVLTKLVTVLNTG